MKQHRKNLKLKKQRKRQLQRPKRELKKKLPERKRKPKNKQENNAYKLKKRHWPPNLKQMLRRKHK